MSARDHVWIVEVNVGTTDGRDAVWMADSYPFRTRRQALASVADSIAGQHVIAHRVATRRDYRVVKYVRASR